MKKLILPIILTAILVLTIFNTEWISNKIADILEKNPKVVTLPSNKYTKDYDFEYVNFSPDYKPYSKQDLKNIFFSVINNGWDRFTFYCPSEYTKCIEDATAISEDDNLLTNINNYVHPFNGFTNISTTFYENGEVILEVHRVYTDSKIKEIETYVDDSLKELIKEDMEIEDKVLTIHDDIINKAKYDVPRSENKESPYESHTAYGIFFQGYGICSGYADAMAIYLEKLGVKNMKVASDTHVWNGVLMNDEWLHLDLTWDDPVNSDGSDDIWHTFFLINNESLLEQDKDTHNHNFDKSVYLEFNN